MPTTTGFGPPSWTTASRRSSTWPTNPASSTRRSSPIPTTSFVPVLESVFIWVPPAIAVTDLIVNGTLAAAPGAAHRDRGAGPPIWVPQYLLMLDGGWDFTSEAQRPASRLTRPAAERVLPPPGTRVRRSPTSSPPALAAKSRRPVHVLQRLPPLRGHGHAHGGLRAVRVRARRATPACSATTCRSCSVSRPKFK